MSNVSQIKKDYLAKVNDLWRKYPIYSKLPYVGPIRSLYGTPNVNLDVDATPDQTRRYESKVYGLIECNGRLMCIFSDYDNDYMESLESLSAADIVKVYNNLEEDYQRNKDKVWFVFKEALAVGDTVRYVGRDCKVLAINDDSVELEHIGKVSYPSGFAHNVTLPID